jgi:hypothetical protein
VSVYEVKDTAMFDVELPDGISIGVEVSGVGPP